MTTESPFNSIPPIVIVLSVIVFGLEGLFSLGASGVVGGPQGVGWRVSAFEDFGFSPAVWDLVVERGVWSADLAWRFVTYAFIHPTFTSALFGGAMLLALGKFVGEVFHWAAVLAIVFGGILFGAICFGVLVSGNPPLLGIYPAVYSLIGAFTYLMWLRLGQTGQNQLAAFRLIGFLLGLQLFFSVMGPLFPSWGGNPGWIADIAGFVFGLALSPFVAPGGWAAFVRRMRER